MIRKMQEMDLERIEQIEKQCFKDPWKPKDFLYELNENPFSTGYVYIENNEIVAYAFLWITFEIAQIANIATDPMYRHQQIGYKMMQEMMQVARNQECEFMSLEVRASNHYALSLYEKCGFIQVNISKGYYPDGEDAIVMTVAL